MLPNTEILPINQTITSQHNLQSQTQITIEDENIANIDDESNGYIEKLNYDIGYFWWKQYVYCAFWSNISTPINLLITILTALTTGQSATNSLISESTNTQLGITALFISIFNTFFVQHNNYMIILKC